VVTLHCRDTDGKGKLEAGRVSRSISCVVTGSLAASTACLSRLFSLQHDADRQAADLRTVGLGR
jgi:hypothetical protein